MVECCHHGGNISVFCMAFQGDSIFWVEVEKIVPNPFQPRREFDEEKLRELGDSIRMYGVLQPLTVTRKEVHRDDGTFFTEYELIAGERRLRASKLANVEQVPVIIRSGEQTEQEKLELAIIENLQREDLNAVDRALAFKQLAEAFDLSFTQVAKKVGRSREYVSNSVRLLALPDHILESVKRAEITEGHGRTLLMLKDKPEELEVIYREILLKKLSVREVERIARKIASDKVRKKSWVNTDAHLIEMEREFTDTLGTRVQISKTDYGGKLTIDYFTESELEKLLHVIKSQRTLLEQAGASEANETNIQELAEAESALAALTNSTPLQAEDNPKAADTNAPAEHVPSEVTATSAPTPESESTIPSPSPTQEIERPAATELESSPQPQAPEANQVTNSVSLVADPAYTHVEESTVLQQNQQSVESNPVSATEDSNADVPAKQPEAPYVAEPIVTAVDSEVTEHAANPSNERPARPPRVIAIFNERKTYLTDVVDVAAAPVSPARDSSITGPNTDSVEPEPAATDTKTPDDDEDLYSINRFSI